MAEFNAATFKIFMFYTQPNGKPTAFTNSRELASHIFIEP